MWKIVGDSEVSVIYIYINIDKTIFFFNNIHVLPLLFTSESNIVLFQMYRPETFN